MKENKRLSFQNVRVEKMECSGPDRLLMLLTMASPL